MKHDNCTHGTDNAWTIEPTRRYFQRCDSCGVRRPWANHYEVYYADADREECCWWWECTNCLIKTISDYAEVWQLDRAIDGGPWPEMSAGEIQRAERAERAHRELIARVDEEWGPIGEHDHPLLESEQWRERHEGNNQVGAAFPPTQGHRGGMKSVAARARSLGATLPWGEEYDILPQNTD